MKKSHIHVPEIFLKVMIRLNKSEFLILMLLVSSCIKWKRMKMKYSLVDLIDKIDYTKTQVLYSLKSLESKGLIKRDIDVSPFSNYENRVLRLLMPIDGGDYYVDYVDGVFQFIDKDAKIKKKKKNVKTEDEKKSEIADLDKEIASLLKKVNKKNSNK